MAAKLVSIVTPVAPYHDAVLPRAVASVEAQTIPCEHIIVRDDENKGAGWARNYGLERVQTPFVVFLDADDTIAPEFLEKTLTAYKPNHYVYTDWISGDKHQFCECPWTVEGAGWHVITTLLPTSAVRAVGRFDETLLSFEDTYLYWALTRAGICGIRIPEALFNYGVEGRRARAYVRTPYHEEMMHALVEKYRGLKMGCCGDNGVVMPVEEGSPLKAGFVEAYAIWGGNMQKIGPVSGLLYPYSGNGKIMQVDERDVAAAPHLWRKVAPPVIPTPPKPSLVGQVVDYQRQPVQQQQPKVAEGVEGVAEALWPERNETEVAPPKVKPDVEKVLKLAKRGRPRKNA